MVGSFATASAAVGRQEKFDETGGARYVGSRERGRGPRRGHGAAFFPARARKHGIHICIAVYCSITIIQRRSTLSSIYSRIFNKSVERQYNHAACSIIIVAGIRAYTYEVRRNKSYAGHGFRPQTPTSAAMHHGKEEAR